MLPFDAFSQALPYDAFLAKHGTAADKERWDRVRKAISLTAEQKALLAKFTRTTNVLVLAGAWCGDCVSQCPIFEHFAEASPKLAIRYLDRNAHPDVQRELQINGGNRVPVVVFFSEDGYEVVRYGERTLTAYRRMAGETGGDTCGSGIAGAGDTAGIVADWLREFERVQYILRLSGRLRKLHAD